MRVLLIGGGQLTYFLAKQFDAAGYHLTLINRNEAEAQSLFRHLKATVIYGEGSDPAILREACQVKMDVLLALTGHDQDNLVACQIAQSLGLVERSIALVNDPDYQAVFESLGIAVAFSATQILANLIKQRAKFFDIKSLFSLASGKVNVTELVLDAQSPALGKMLQALPLPEGSLVGCIIRNETMIVPRGNSELQQGDRLILISEPEQEEQLLQYLIGPSN